MENNLGMKIKNLRIKNNLTQQQLADKIGVSNKAVSKWENNDGVPDIENLKLVSNVFKVSLDELLANQPVKKKKTKVDISLLVISGFTLVLYLMPFIAIDPFEMWAFNEEAFLFVHVSGLNLMLSFFRSLKFFNLVIVIASGFIFVNTFMHILRILKAKNFKRQKLFSLLAMLCSIVVLAVMLIVKHYDVTIEQVTFVPYLLVFIQIIQYLIYRMDKIID